MITNIRKMTVMMMSAILAGVLIIGCDNDEAITYSVTDVSSRITGFNKDVAGPGASLAINGSQMDKVVRIFIGEEVVTKGSFTAVSPESITFNVPLTVSLGEAKVLLVYEGNERATTKINIVALPAISNFYPSHVKVGDIVTVVGANLNASFVSAVNVGGASATINHQAANILRFTVPAGFATNKITLVSPAGDVTSATDLTSCADNPNNLDCKAAINPNPGFELGTGDDFTNWGKWNGPDFMVATTEPGEVYSGTRALKVIRNGQLSPGEWRIQLSNDPSTWEVGASYTVHVWAKASAAGGSMRVSTNPSAMYTGNQEVPTTWTRLSFTFPAANEPSSRVVLDMNGNEGAVTTFFIDEVKLVKD